jgi:hypothetical protein
MPDAATTLLGTVFAGSLTAMLGYVGTTVASDRARAQRTEDALDRCRSQLEEEIRGRRLAEQALAMAELTIARLRIEYGDSDRGRP